MNDGRVEEENIETQIIYLNYPVIYTSLDLSLCFFRCVWSILFSLWAYNAGWSAPCERINTGNQRQFLAHWGQNPSLSPTLAFVRVHMEWWQRLVLRHFWGTIPTSDHCQPRPTSRWFMMLVGCQQFGASATPLAKSRSWIRIQHESMLRWTTSTINAPWALQLQTSTTIPNTMADTISSWADWLVTLLSRHGLTWRRKWSNTMFPELKISAKS